MRVLVTTALEQSWPVNEPVLFLGEWCRRHSRRDKWQQFDSQVMPYHWDDRNRLLQDYDRLIVTYERLLTDLGETLNDQSGSDRSDRYWRILAGPWLGLFVQMAWDRWRMVEEAERRVDVSGTIVLEGIENAVVPSGMVDFTRLFTNDEWNHYLYRRIFEERGGHALEYRLYDPGETEGPVGSISLSVSTKVRMLRFWSCLAARLARKNDVAVVSPFMAWSAELALHRRLGQVPLIWSFVSQPNERFEPRQRTWAMRGSAADEFESFVRVLIPEQIPAAYLEGHGRLVEMVGEARWPAHPPVVFTSNSHYSDDVFKAWAADRVERGSRLAIGQHGGNFGISRRLWNEDLEVAIADRYLSWGWSDESRKKIRPVGQIYDRPPSTVDHGANETILMVTNTVPRQSYHLFSGMVSSQWLSYLQDQFAFVESLPKSLREHLLVRLYRHDYGWDQQSRWEERLPEVRLEPGVAPIRDLISKCRIYVSTYNATTFLETFAMDVPTVMFWNPDHWELRDSVVDVFSGLHEVGILHNSAASAAEHLAAVWDDVVSWWGDTAVSTARLRFNEELNWNQSDVVGAIAREIVDLAGEDCPRRLRSRSRKWATREEYYAH